MIPIVLVLLSAPPAAEPVPPHDLLLEVGDRPPIRVRLTIKVNGKPLAELDAAAARARDARKGKPGAATLDRLAPDGSLLHVGAIPAAPHAPALSSAIFKTLDGNSDGKLSPEELANAKTVLLAKFDLDDDECITPLELVPDLQTVVPTRKPSAGAVRIRIIPTQGKADLEHTITLGRGATHWRGKVGGVWIEIHARPSLPSEEPLMPKSLLAADRADMKAAFETAAASVVSLSAVPAPIGLFDLLDTDRDGQISIPELRAAKTVLANGSPIERGVSLVIVRGVAKPPVVPLVRTFTHVAGPPWFRAMDRNGDGHVSPREFLGTPSQFRTLDTNADGLLGPEEARMASPPEVSKP